MINILLNNYCEKLNDAAVLAKCQSKDKKSHKLATLAKAQFRLSFD
jgi:hypothetical protein